MAINVKPPFSKGLMLLFSVMSLSLFGQNKEEQQIKTVFDQLTVAYGSAKSAPDLIFKKMSIPAKYMSEGKPKIIIDQNLFSICRTFGKDSLNALAIVLSHELAHYYSDHTFCSDYAYAYLKPENPKASKVARDSGLNAKIEKETEADFKGFFYSAAAGFQPFDLQHQLIETLYKSYKLTDLQPGYPSKQKRKELAKGAETKANELFAYFQEGLNAMKGKKYDAAILAFDKANSFIPYRENFNNLGVAKTLKALALKVITNEEFHQPNRFLYPLELENKSRLAKETTRTLDDQPDDMEKLLKGAQKNFQEAIRLDSNFTKAYINLACVLDLLDDPMGAISIITKQLLPKEARTSVEAQRILAIAYFHNGQEQKAEEVWKQLKI